MSEQVKTHIEEPFGWIFEDYGTWELISDYTDNELYSYLDAIYHILVDGANPDDFAEFKGMTTEELEGEYNKKFPLLMANLFENLAKDIKSGELEIETEF